VAKVTKNTIFKVILDKEALSIGSKGSSIGALRHKERSLTLGALTPVS
jgi:hypothetical protein